MPSGYYRYPTIYNEIIVFVSEDDLWSVPAAGGIARRLTSNLGEVTHPRLSPDGKQLAFVGREEAQSEIYLMPAQGGPARRLTYNGGGQCLCAGWRGDQILFASNARQPFQQLLWLYTLDPNTLNRVKIPVGPAGAISYGPGGGMVIGRYTQDPARWKRYRGGTAGQLWIDPDGDGRFHPLIHIEGNLAAPMWIGERIYFISDYEGVGNLYSCLPSGKDLRRHTDHGDYYSRGAASDGQRIVYHAGGNLYLYDPAAQQGRQIQVEFNSPQTQRNRKFVNPTRYLTDWDIHPKGHSLAVATRGQVFTFSNWEGAAILHRERPAKATHSTPTGNRYRLPAWLKDGKRVIAVSDEGGEESFVIFNADGSGETKTLTDLDIGRPEALAVNSQKDQIAFSNHRYELLFLDLETKELRRIDRGLTAPISGFDWSPDGEWIAYSVSISLQVRVLKLWKAETGETFPLTRPVLRDVAPAFDPRGRYLYFISYRTFDPVYDNLHFDLNFPRGMRPYLITLQKDLPNPFIPRLRVEDEKERGADTPGEKPAPAPASEPKEEAEKLTRQASPVEETDKKDDDKKPERKLIQIDLEGIEQRVLAFPAPDGIYGRVMGIRDGKVIYTRFPVEGTLNHSWVETEPSTKGTLYSFNFDDLKEEVLYPAITDFRLSPGGAVLAYRSGYRLRVLRIGEKPNGENDAPSRKSGWIDLSRLKVSVLPGAEWRQMFREAWRLQRDQFWTPDMSQVDWIAVHDRYLPLVDRVSSRSEFSDLMWEMQGELGTSHAYEIGGDYRAEPNYDQGNLGADFEFDSLSGGWRITHIVAGDAWEARATSPLGAPGTNIQVGDCLLAINGIQLDSQTPPAAALVNQAGEDIQLTIQPAASRTGQETETNPPGDANMEPAPTKKEDEKPEIRNVTVRALSGDMPARYREWVEANRQRVHQTTDDRVGYVHIPDMGPRGYAEFHRGYLAEVDRQGLIIDVRYNGGGHVSALILEKLARRRLGYDTSRWSLIPTPYPPESVEGPLVALTNEYAGSDGDIFCHGFKLMKLGPLVGKRTWGGVIGINPRQALVDGTITTQPEYSFWFSDVGWEVENYGTQPDIEVDNLPSDYAQGVDAQLERAIAEALKMLEAHPPQAPEFTNRPSRAIPRLPER